mmetsp:Transcript_109316/g.214258  ORF Transcript_109316/g.214258 Transcript_109316/m.214258 type:complete len:206 (-) Transcript_109316:444-1061(-)
MNIAAHVLVAIALALHILLLLPMPLLPLVLLQLRRRRPSPRWGLLTVTKNLRRCNTCWHPELRWRSRIIAKVRNVLAVVPVEVVHAPGERLRMEHHDVVAAHHEDVTLHTKPFRGRCVDGSHEGRPLHLPMHLHELLHVPREVRLGTPASSRLDERRPYLRELFKFPKLDIDLRQAGRAPPPIIPFLLLLLLLLTGVRQRECNTC